MGLQAYRGVLAVRDVRRVLLLILAVRIPIWAGNVVLTLHVVTHLHRSYGAAGVVEAAATIAISLSSPWRGRRLDRVGLRATIAPSLGVLTVCWSIAPFVGYVPLLGLVSLAGLFLVPSFSIVRQALINAVPESERRTALSIDSVMTEVTFMIGPPVGVLLASYWSTSWVLLACEFASIAGSAALWLADPPLRPDAAADTVTGTGSGVRQWLTGDVLGILVMSAATVLVLTGTGVATVAALRHMHHQSWIGWQLAVWGLGSAVGGIVYGGLRRSVPVPWLLILLSGTTVPVALSSGPGMLAILLFVTGIFCAPTITAAVEALSRAVPDNVRGEVLGWHGSAMTGGAAAGAPLAGIAIDRVGWSGGFAIVGVIGVLAAAGGSWRARRRPAAADPLPERLLVDEVGGPPRLGPAGPHRVESP